MAGVMGKETYAYFYDSTTAPNSPPECGTVKHDNITPVITMFSAVILGIVEGFTEFLPISSTAHLILASRLLSIAQSEFTKTFEIAIQSGAILAVVVLYWRTLLRWTALKKMAAAFIPTGIIGVAIYPFVKSELLENTAVVLFSLAIGGVLLIAFEQLFREKTGLAGIEDIGYGKAIAIGLFQSVAMIPGISRAAATIVGGMLLGIPRAMIVEFSFLLAVPTMLAATGLDLVKNAGAFSPSELGVLAIGFTTSFLTAVFGIKFLLQYIRRHSFAAFGVYRILLVAAFLLLISR